MDPRRLRGLDKDILEAALGKQGLGGNDEFSSTRFSGTFHGEPVLAALAVIANTKDARHLFTKEWLESNGIFATQSELLK
jgi:hypothetical protein